jgi:hypothetical protein
MKARQKDIKRLVQDTVDYSVGPGALFRDDLRTTFSISGIVIFGHSISGGYAYLLISERSAWSGGGKKV